MTLFCKLIFPIQQQNGTLVAHHHALFLRRLVILEKKVDSDLNILYNTESESVLVPVSNTMRDNIWTRVLFTVPMVIPNLKHPVVF